MSAPTMKDIFEKQHRTALIDRQTRFWNWIIGIVFIACFACIAGWLWYTVDGEFDRLQTEIETLRREKSASEEQVAQQAKENKHLARELAACKGKNKSVFTPDGVWPPSGWEAPK